MKIFSRILLVVFFTSCLFSIDFVDVSRNYQYREHISYLAENHYLPVFIDNTFQFEATLTLYQTALSLMFVSGITIDFQTEEPFLAEYVKDTIEYPYIQHIHDNEYILEGMDGYATCNVADAIRMFSKVYDGITFSLEDKAEDDYFTRRDFISFMTSMDEFNSAVNRFRVERRRRQDDYVGSAVSDYILGYTGALERIELSRYFSGKREYYDMFWKFASERDKLYQKVNEDLSREDLDILDKRLNQALLNFYGHRYWLVIQQCNIILREDPRHIGALELKGSSFYMLRKFDIAKKYWERALHYQPGNKELSYFLKILP